MCVRLSVKEARALTYNNSSLTCMKKGRMRIEGRVKAGKLKRQSECGS